MQPERKIERWLRGYAKRRRSAAGDSLPMPPATRRRLQEEVARRADAHLEGGGKWLSIWWSLRQRWVFLAGSAFAVLLAAALIVPVWPSRKLESRSTETLAMKNPAPVAPAPMTPPSAQPASMPLPEDHLSLPPGNMPMGKKVPPIVGATNINSPTLVLADKPMTPATAGEYEYEFKQNETDRVAGVTLARRERLPVVTDSFGGAGGGGGAADGTLSGVRPGNLAGAIQYQAVLTNSFQSGASPAFQPPSGKESSESSSFQNMASAAKAGIVLARFKVIQNGADIQIVDSDGSIYRGSWEPKVAQKTFNRALINANNQIAGQNVQVAASVVQSPIGGGASVQTASQVYSLRVSGDNRTLKQRIVFTGDLSLVLTADSFANNALSANDALTSPAANAVPSTGMTVNNTVSNGSIQQPIWLNSFILGKAIVGGTNQVEVNAISVPP